MPGKYRVKEIVEAFQITPETLARAVAWSSAIPITEIDPFDPSKTYVAVNVPTAGAIVRVSEPDYLVKRAGVFVQMYKAEFEAEYERIS